MQRAPRLEYHQSGGRKPTYFESFCCVVVFFRAIATTGTYNNKTVIFFDVVILDLTLVTAVAAEPTAYYMQFNCLAARLDGCLAGCCCCSILLQCLHLMMVLLLLLLLRIYKYYNVYDVCLFFVSFFSFAWCCNTSHHHHRVHLLFIGLLHKLVLNSRSTEKKLNSNNTKIHSQHFFR